MVAATAVAHPRASCWIADHRAPTRPGSGEPAAVTTALGAVLTAELHGAAGALAVPVSSILLAALARTVATTIGTGVLGVDVTADDLPIDPVPAVGTATRVIAVCCEPAGRLPATRLLAQVLAGLSNPQYGARADVALRLGRGRADGLGRPRTGARAPLTLHVRTARDSVRLDWRFDTRRFDRGTVAELAEQFPLAMIEITSEGVSPDRAEPPGHAV